MAYTGRRETARRDTLAGTAKLMNIGPYELDSIVTGDARQLAQALPDDSFDMVLCDPPFGINFAYDGYTDASEPYAELVKWIAETANRIVKPGGICFVFQAQPQLRLTWPLFPEHSRIFVAAKNFVQIRPIPVQYAYDPVVFWQKEGGRLIDDYKGRDWHIGQTSVTKFRGMNEAGFHECPRPLDTCQYIVGNFSPRGGTVCDLFMGSGTTAVAAKTFGRHWLGFELRSEIAELARQRVAQAQTPLFVEMPEQPALMEAA